MSRLGEWWESLFSKDRRKTNRVHDPKLAVYYWMDARPEQHEVRDISPTGIYVVTDERWYPGTTIKMTLQRTDGHEETLERHIVVESKAVRWGDDGVGLTFVLPDKSGTPKGTQSILDIADKKTLQKFLSRYFKHPE